MHFKSPVVLVVVMAAGAMLYAFPRQAFYQNQSRNLVEYYRPPIRGITARAAHHKRQSILLLHEHTSGSEGGLEAEGDGKDVKAGRAGIQGLVSGDLEDSIQVDVTDQQLELVKDGKKDCVKHLILRKRNGSGFGHSFAGIVGAFDVALDKKFALVFDSVFWTQGGDHGAYPWLEPLLLYPFKNTNTFKSPSQGWVDKNNIDQAECGAVREFDTVTDDPGAYCLVTIYCFVTTPGLYQRPRALLSKVYHQSPARPALLERAIPWPSYCESKTMVVGWHFRLGDLAGNPTINSQKKEFVHGILNALHDGFKGAGVKYEIYALHEGDPSKSKTPPSQLQEAFEDAPYADGVWFLSNNDNQVDFARLAEADVTVGTGSTFWQASATVSHKSTVILQTKMKETKAHGDLSWKSYLLDGAIDAYDGTVDEENMELLKNDISKRKRYLESSC